MRATLSALAVTLAALTLSACGHSSTNYSAKPANTTAQKIAATQTINASDVLVTEGKAPHAYRTLGTITVHADASDATHADAKAALASEAAAQGANAVVGVKYVTDKKSGELTASGLAVVYIHGKSHAAPAAAAAPAKKADEKKPAKK